MNTVDLVSSDEENINDNSEPKTVNTEPEQNGEEGTEGSEVSMDDEEFSTNSSDTEVSEGKDSDWDSGDKITLLKENKQRLPLKEKQNEKLKMNHSKRKQLGRHMEWLEQQSKA